MVILRSKRFWASIGSIIFVIMKDLLDIPISEDTVVQFITIVGCWVVSDGIRPKRGRKEKEEAVVQVRTEV